MANLIGEYECRLDGKSRIILPSGLKKQIPPEAKDRFVINRGFEKCLVLYPFNEWEKISADVSELNLFIRKNRDFARYFNRGATELVMDTQNRLLIPRGLLDYAGIDRDMVLSAFANRVEIWSKEAFEAMLLIEPEDYSRLAEEVMGRKDQNKPENVP